MRQRDHYILFPLTLTLSQVWRNGNVFVRRRPWRTCLRVATDPRGHDDRCGTFTRVGCIVFGSCGSEAYGYDNGSALCRQSRHNVYYVIHMRCNIYVNCCHSVRKECLAHRAYNRFRTAIELLESAESVDVQGPCIREFKWIQRIYWSVKWEYLQLYNCNGRHHSVLCFLSLFFLNK